MKTFSVFLTGIVLALTCSAAWYWPFDSDGGSSPPRLSEMMQPASDLIDEASDLAYDGKTREAVEKYRAALNALDQIEMENPERAKKPEFATLRNKRAYVNAAIDALLMAQVQENAKAVAVSDTTELEKRLAKEKEEAKKAREAKEKELREEKAAKAKAKEKAKEKAKANEMEKKPEKAKVAPKETVKEKKAKPETAGAAPRADRKATKPLNRRDQALADLAKGDYEAALLSVRILLAEKPNNATALNIRAAIEVAQGRYKDAEKTLDQAIMSNPRNHFAFYNMARLMIRMDASSKEAAKRYYETGRSVGGAVDAELEKLLK